MRVPFEFVLSVPSSDIESVYRHVHHAQTLRYLELGRLELLKSIGVPNESLTSRGLFLVITSLNVQYKREVFAGEIRVTVENARVSEKALLLDQKLYNDRGKLAVEATVELKCLSSATKRAVEPPVELLKALGV